MNYAKLVYGRKMGNVELDNRPTLRSVCLHDHSDDRALKKSLLLCTAKSGFTDTRREEKAGINRMEPFESLLNI